MEKRIRRNKNRPFQEIEAAQAWFFLKANSYKSISILEGGLNEWKSKILFPVCTCGDNPSIEQIHKHDKLSEVSEFFGGAIQTVKIKSEGSQPDMPVISAPAKITLKKAAGKKKREGC